MEYIKKGYIRLKKVQSVFSGYLPYLKDYR